MEAMPSSTEGTKDTAPDLPIRHLTKEALGEVEAAA
jgi:hypothetical protein